MARNRNSVAKSQRQAAAAGVSRRRGREVAKSNPNSIERQLKSAATQYVYGYSRADREQARKKIQSFLPHTVGKGKLKKYNAGNAAIYRGTRGKIGTGARSGTTKKSVAHKYARLGASLGIDQYGNKKSAPKTGTAKVFSSKITSSNPSISLSKVLGYNYNKENEVIVDASVFKSVSKSKNLKGAPKRRVSGGGGG